MKTCFIKVKIRFDYKLKLIKIFIFVFPYTFCLFTGRIRGGKYTLDTHRIFQQRDSS